MIYNTDLDIPEDLKTAIFIHNDTMNEILEQLKDYKKVENTFNIDKFIEKNIIKLGGKPGNLGYMDWETNSNYPYSSCLAVNNDRLHEYPSINKKLNERDYLRIDFSVKFGEWYSDSCKTIRIGTDCILEREFNRQIKNFIEKTKKIVMLTDFLDYNNPKFTVKLHSHFIGKNMHARIPDATYKGYIFYCYEPILYFDNFKLQFEFLIAYHIATKQNFILLSY